MIMRTGLKTPAILAVVMTLAVSVDVHAQSKIGQRSGQIGRPTTSPYLNLLNGGNRPLDLGLQYYQQVRPQQQFRSAIGQLQRTQNRLLNTVNSSQPALQAPASQLGVTGHPTSFMNLGGYYPSLQSR